MKIRSFFLLCMAAVAVISLALSAVITQVAWQRLQEKDAGIGATEAFSVALKALELLALERAPTNTVLNAEQASDPVAAKRLGDARAILDNTLKDLADRLPADDRQTRDQIASLQRSIVATRVLVDREGAKPKAQREANVMADVARTQLALNDMFLPIIARSLQSVTRADPDLAGLAAVAGAAAETREVTGRKGASITGALAAGRKLTDAEIIAVDQLEGRGDQLRRGMEQLLGRIDPNPAIDQAWSTAKSRYFEGGARMLVDIIEAGRKGGAYPVNYTQFIERIVPDLQSILGVRDAALKVAIAAAVEKRGAAARTLWLGVGSMVLVLVVLGGVSWAFTARVVSPLSAMTGVVGRLAGGERDVAVPFQARADEIGAMAKAVEIFRQNAIEAERLQQEAAESRVREAEMQRVQEARERDAAEERRQREEAARQAEIQRQRDAAEAQRQAEIARQAEAERMRQEAEARRRSELQALAGSFDTAIGGVVDAVASAATEMQATATSMTGIADRTARQSLAAATATEQAAGSVQTVASASEELSASIREIAGQVATSSRIASNAVAQAQRTDAIVQGLASSAEKIGEVVGLINQIAGQTNLLALNATIEAARAGEAGKGFAVVASEVKNLATQTSKATDEIGQQIGSVQTATQEAVAAIREIGGVIGQINEIASAIAAAVEQQGAATNEIARSVEQAANGTKEASVNVGQVNQSAREAGAAAGQVLDASGELSRQAERLRAEVGSFLGRIRAG
ncbi:MAG: methyl-accepting chemotaxis protein [Ferrovibrionaceae bacterium]